MGKIRASGQVGLHSTETLGFCLLYTLFLLKSPHVHASTWSVNQFVYFETRAGVGVEWSRSEEPRKRVNSGIRDKKLFWRKVESNNHFISTFWLVIKTNKRIFTSPAGSFPVQQLVIEPGSRQIEFIRKINRTSVMLALYLFGLTVDFFALKRDSLGCGASFHIYFWLTIFRFWLQNSVGIFNT